MLEMLEINGDVAIEFWSFSKIIESEHEDEMSDLIADEEVRVQRISC